MRYLRYILKFKFLWLFRFHLKQRFHTYFLIESKSYENWEIERFHSFSLVQNDNNHFYISLWISVQTLNIQQQNPMIRGRIPSTKLDSEEVILQFRWKRSKQSSIPVEENNGTPNTGLLSRRRAKQSWTLRQCL